MTDEMTCTIPIPLSINRTYKVKAVYSTSQGRWIGRMYKSAEAVAYQREVYYAVLSAVNEQGFSVQRDELLGWEMLLYPPNLRSDSDGGIKGTRDAIADALGINDRAFRVNHIEQIGVDKENPRAVLRIWKLSIDKQIA